MVDFGKIIALHNAGWDIAKIADEMCLTEQEYAIRLLKNLTR